MGKVGRQVQRLFLRLLNFAPELLAKTQKEAELQHAGFDAIVRDALGKYKEDLKVSREKDTEAETREYARLVLSAHFAEDRNEFLTENAIRCIGKDQR